MRLFLAMGTTFAILASSAKDDPSPEKRRSNRTACGGAFLIAVDVGHSKSDPGAVSSRGVPEFEYNQRLAAEALAALNGAGFSRSFLIDASGNGAGSAGLMERAQTANDRKADLLISVHHDSVQRRYLRPWVIAGHARQYSDRFSGYSIFCSAGSDQRGQSLRFARLLADELRKIGRRPSLHHAEDIPGEAYHLVDRERGIYTAEFVVIKNARMPAVLLEAGVIVNRAEERRLATAEYRAGTVRAIVASVSEFCDAGAR